MLDSFVGALLAFIVYRWLGRCWRTFREYQAIERWPHIYFRHTWRNRLALAWERSR
jgi:uncharacterized membrane protein YdjX (TVP38/TMEM64 family)